MKYLISGAAGFIGWNLSKNLLGRGDEVIGVDNMNSVLYSSAQKRSNLETLMKHPNFKFFEMDISDKTSYSVINQVFPEIVINEAGLPGQSVSWSNVDAYLKANVLGASTLAEWAVDRGGVRKFVQASTSSVYGDLAIGTEDEAYNPSSPYGVTKAAAEMMLKLVFSGSEVSYSVVRYFSVYGPGQRPDMGIYKFIDAGLHHRVLEIYGDGTQSRDFTYIDDAVAATITVAESGENGKIYNVSGGNSITINKLLEILEIELGELNIVFKDQPRGDQLHTKADTSRLRQELGWSSEIDCLRGVKNQIAWQRMFMDSRQDNLARP